MLENLCRMDQKAQNKDFKMQTGTVSHILKNYRNFPKKW